MTADAAPFAKEASESVLDRSDPRWVRLRAIIEDKSLKRGDFTLSSGRKSNYLFQLRQTTMLAEGAALIGEIIAEYMQRNGIRCVGGLEMGAVPIVVAVAVASHHQKHPADAFFVRKKAKEHGARERIDGNVDTSGEILIVDDVATTGNSFVVTGEGLREEYPHAVSRRGLVVVDREEGAAEALSAKGIRLASIFRKSDFAV